MKAVFEGNSSYVICKVQSDKGVELYAVLTVLLDCCHPENYSLVNLKLTSSRFKYYCAYFLNLSFELLMKKVGKREEFYDADDEFLLF